MVENGKVTIYDLARELNTTASTISRALQDNPRISAKTRKAVQELAKRYNYIPDPVAHHLRTGRGNVLGIVVPRIDRNFFASIISSFQTTALKNKYNIIICASNESVKEEENAVRALMSKKVDGIAISLSVETQDANYEQQCAAYGIPVIYFDRVPVESTTDFVANDNEQIGYDAVMHLYEQGCRRIAHFAGPLKQRSYAERLAGYRRALKDCGLEYDEKLVFQNSITLETGEVAANKILKMKNRPDGIFSAGDFSAITAMDIFRNNGIRMPEDIAVIGVANEPFDNYLATPLSSFDLHQNLIGERAAEILIGRLNAKGNDEKPETLNETIKHDLILRKSASK